MKNEENTALAHPPTTPIPHAQPGMENGGGRTQSLHLKYACSKRSVSNSSSLYTLFYSVIYNSVSKIQRYAPLEKPKNLTFYSEREKY